MHWEFLTDNIEEQDLLLDCRGAEAYAEKTLRGAYGAAMIKKPFGSGPNSQMKIATLVSEVKKLSGEGRRVVCFDEGQGMYACRMAWLLISASFTGVKIFSRKFSEVDEGLCGEGNGQLEGETNGTPLELNGIASLSYLQKNLTRVQLVDTRTPQEYSGEIPRLSNFVAGALCGRIPGSINWDWRLLYGRNGSLKEKIKVIGDIKRVGLIQERQTVLYDYNGARSSTTALVLNSCGYKHVSVYLGSWMEWQKTSLPKQNFSAWSA